MKPASKIDRGFFNGQILRLSATQFFPQLKPAVTELIDTLIRVAGGHQVQARRIIDHALEKFHDCPTPMDLSEIASNLGWCDGAPRGCRACEGTGRRYVQIRGMDCQAPCECALGQFLKAKDAERHREDSNAHSMEPTPASAALSKARSRDKHGPNQSIKRSA